ncbi:Pentatricopeptide repeat-containing protein, putative isoform 1 [Hibiscus syriacus]|uniref:Pentatricopeptide repeat-containing protein, putative isoform 1 n=1 Tax=Hibiscus syriacus TaxID=106335 RepID=A0A6A3B3A1_HIBSY|nr:agamous-like MADS-box protein AGL80 [Hibiscus syriacus]KAE8709752.1 Pentatricopeptide repeat-containing protein, putative isoform 1 [Hibiscus syriacus]
MGRRKTTYELIANEFARKNTLKKRKAGLLKKLNELTTLCDVPACAIIFSSHDSQPDVWPSRAGACQVLEKFGSLPEEQRGKHMTDQTIVLKRNILQLNDRLEKQRKKNEELEKELALIESMADENNCDWNNLEELEELSYQLQQNIEFISNMIKN